MLQNRNHPSPVRENSAIMQLPQRLAKHIAASGLCSRRQAEQWIADGRVTVDGTPVTSPALNVTAAQAVCVDGSPLPSPPTSGLWRFHKPKGMITSHKDEQNRPTIFDALPASMRQFHTVGRLDFNSEGLLLLTNTPSLKHRLEQPANGWQRVYRVRVKGRPSDKTLAALQQGVTVEGFHYRPVGARLLPDSKGHNHWLEVVLQEGKNREIRKIFEHFGHPVSRLIRTGYGPVALGKLAPGKWAAITIPPQDLPAEGA
jgi:23S rRNA pseudouridine2605 synthase